MPPEQGKQLEDLQRGAEAAQDDGGWPEDGTMAPWAVIDVASGTPVGMTTFMHIDARTPRLEIGSTWLLCAGPNAPASTRL
ncbi:hypothetical protein [Nesterenkonia sp. HG001]|uniref:GNAT family N-acetyltransferase n=1 Tax=Nesterenkonia sp. HG001 TaxID=2983207 RepID=UPI002AC39F52|nr:hypothetical protein [Nesterenkonia sp. HG001]MDZ5077097.1 hypothetical protein [Nesterenkonia sp. HG001]